jgi:hypothetical protein
MFEIPTKKVDEALYDSKARRVWLFTLNNPTTEEILKLRETGEKIDEIKAIDYLIYQGEIGLERKTKHIQGYVELSRGRKFQYLKKVWGSDRYHFHPRYERGNDGSIHYCRKPCPNNNCGNKHCEKIREYMAENKLERNAIVWLQCEEYGEPKKSSSKYWEGIIDLIEEGADFAQILQHFPSAMQSMFKIEKAIAERENRKASREWINDKKVYWIYGTAGIGKSYFVRYNNKDLFYFNSHNKNGWDLYRGEKTVLMDEYNENIPIALVNQWLDQYPCPLPCRYNDKYLKATTIFIISNINPFDMYKEVNKELRASLYRRCNAIVRMMEDENGRFFKEFLNKERVELNELYKINMGKSYNEYARTTACKLDFIDGLFETVDRWGNPIDNDSPSY